MAYVFKEGKMASNQLDVMLTNGIAEDEIIDGALVVLGDLADNDTYSYGTKVKKEYDTYKVAAPEAATDEVAIVDYAGIESVREDMYDDATYSGPSQNNLYKLGIKMYNLKARKGEYFRVRRLALHDKFWLGEGNFVAAPTVGKYAVATANKYLHTAAAALPASGYAIKILVEEDLTTGMYSNGKLYLCEVVQL